MFETDVASVNLASAVVVFGFFILLLAALPLPIMRQIGLALSRFMVRILLISAIVMLAAWALSPQSEPDVVREAISPLVNGLSTRLGIDGEEAARMRPYVRPYAYLYVAAITTGVGMILVGVLKLSQDLGAHQRLVSKLFSAAAPISRLIASRRSPPKKRLFELLGKQ